MSQNESKKIDPLKEMKKLQVEFFRACDELRQAKDRGTRKALERRINELKVDLGWRFLDCGQHEKGLALYASLPSRSYGEIKCNGMSRALVAMGRYDEARQLLDKGLKRFPQSYSLWVGMGAFEGDIGNDFEALECFETAMRFASENDSTARFNKAQTLRKLGSYGDAIAILKDLIRKDPQDTRNFILMGSCHLDMGYPEEALQEYRLAMELWQENQTAYEGSSIYMGLYMAYRAQGMLREAMVVAEEGLKRFPDEDPGLYQNLGDAYCAMGWRNDATTILKEGIEKFPEDEELKEVLKDMEDTMDDPDGGKNPPILGLLVLMALLRKRFGKGRKGRTGR